MGQKFDDASDLLEGLEAEDIEELSRWLDEPPAPTRRTTGARPTARNHRRAIEELQEQRLLRSLLTDDLNAEFPDL